MAGAVPAWQPEEPGVFSMQHIFAVVIRHAGDQLGCLHCTAQPHLLRRGAACPAVTTGMRQGRSSERPSL
jgi:hypothetical protein